MISFATYTLLLPLLATPIAATLSLSISTSAPGNVKDVGNLKVTTTVLNTGDKTLRLLNEPQSVLSPELITDVFSISKHDTGASPDFHGISLKWSPQLAASDNQFTVLNPGQSLDISHDLSSRYDFASAGAGTFNIVALDTFTHVDESGNFVSVKAAQSSPVSIALTGNLAVQPTVPKPLRFVKRAKFKSCTAAQEKDVNSAVAAAYKYALNAYNYLKSHTSATPRYTTWFGAFAAARHNTVVSHFSKIAGTASNDPFAGFEYDCGCPEAANRTDIYAYVYPNQYGIMYLCQAFWKSPLEGADSQAGTLVHESSHFTANGGTKDLAYGEADCKALAAKSPDQAVMNADSHEYFAENTPPLA